MSDRSQNYWSIGEVLSLLQDEFPEVTISKIRFLESQGLIDPERTPSGYRRFYQIDFDRLQWILTQQRDHYLPLKVIRDRLEAGEWHSSAEGRPDPDDGTRQMTLLAPVIDIRNGEPSTGDGDEEVDGTETDSGAGDTDDTGGDETSANEMDAPDGDRTDRAADADDSDQPSDGAASPSAAAAGEATRTPHEVSSAATDDQQGTAESTASETTEPDESAGDADASVAAGDDQPAAGSAADTDAPPATDETDSPAAQAMAEVDPGIALTLDEIAEASGCDVAMIRELERFGLVKGRTVGPTVLYDGQALTIARHASQFRSFGLDPRHLRTFLVGAEREVALLAQVVEPLRHRRDPETRRKSVETMEDLTDLAASLRAILMRQITREQLPPT